MSSYPATRSQWAALDWKEAHHHVANLLNRHGYMIFEERSFTNNKRSDVVVIHQTSNTVSFGIIEVKCYEKVIPSLEIRAMKQGIQYLKSLFRITHDNQRWGNLTKQYFVAVVYTKDYPVSFYHHKLEKYNRIIPNRLIENYPLTLFSSTPNSLISKLAFFVPEQSKQSKIDDFF